MVDTVVARGEPGWLVQRREECVYCDDELGIFAVADGVGEGRAAWTAARLFCEEVRRHRKLLHEAVNAQGPTRDVRSTALALVERLFNRSAERIFGVGQRTKGLGGMATTGVVLVIGPNGAVVGNVGDTRAYLLKSGQLRRLTEDHTLDEQLRERGLLQPDDELSPRSILSRTIGHTPTVRADTLWLDVSEGDHVPLCTYGMYRSFSDAQLAVLLKGGMERTLRAAARHNGQEEVSGVLVRVLPPGDSPDSLDTTEKVECIRRMPLFAHLGEQELVRILKIVFERQFAAGERLCEEGDVGDSIFVVYSGRLDVSKGRVHLTTVETGGYLGELAFMDGLPRSATVTALEPTRILTFHRDDFRALIQRDPFLSAKVMWSFTLNMGGRLRNLTRQYASILDRGT